METSLHSANLTADTLDTSPKTEQEEQQEHHIHLPNPSLWPLILSVAILITMAGLLSLPDIPAVSIIGAIFILVGILGWGLEDPMGHKAGEDTTKYVPLSAQQVLEQAEEVVEHTVTVSSTAWSAHPVRVELESAGVVLALYGKVELEAQRQEIENAVRALPGVIDVRNFIVAEDEILNIANARLENMRAKGKLDGARDLSILVENYILQLYGEVPNRDMKYALEREMVGIPGVRVVVNHIGLNSDIPGNLGKTRNV
jgi:hypothetical protein